MPKLPMPPFVPTNEHFPEWITAVLIIKNYLPRKLQFALIPEHTRHGRVDLDSSWFVALGEVTPPEDKMKLEELGSKAVALIMGRWHEYKEFHDIIGRANITQHLMARLNSIIDTVDRQAEAEGEPTNLQIIRHLFGIAPAPGTRPQHIKVVATVDQEKLRGVIGDRGFKVYHDPNPESPLLVYKGSDFLPKPTITDPGPYIPIVGPESVVIDLKTVNGANVLTLHRYDIAVPHRHLGAAFLGLSMFKAYLSQYIDKADIVFFEEEGEFKATTCMKDRFNETKP